jgi:hypothetical protein
MLFCCATVSLKDILANLAWWCCNGSNP